MHTTSLDTLERELVDLETLKSRITARQLEVIRQLDVAQVAALDGARTLGEWLTARLDLTTRRAQDLARLATSIDPRLEAELTDGLVSADRAIAETALARTGADEVQLAHARGLPLEAVARLRARITRMTPLDEDTAIENRYLVVQPNLDESTYRLWGQLPGFDGRIVTKALAQRADHLQQSFPNKAPRGERNADATVSIFQDSLDREDPIRPSQDPLVSVFVDAGIAADSRARAGVTTDHGVKVGPRALEEIMCTGAVEVIAVDADRNPIAASPASRVISTKLRRAIIARDGGCVVDGCTSAYRLQPHHVVPFARGGQTTPNNLATVCWYHHHIVIHGQGRQLDPSSPPQRRRFVRPPRRGSDPPVSSGY